MIQTNRDKFLNQNNRSTMKIALWGSARMEK